MIPAQLAAQVSEYRDLWHPEECVDKSNADRILASFHMTFEHRIQQIMSGQAKGILPSLGRSALSAIEPFYRLAVDRRNRRFDTNPDRIRRLPRPVISVGNLTTGGTGKTPVIRWLAGALRDRSLNVAILARGYKAAPGSLGDEQQMLLAMLNGPPLRVRGAPTPPGPKGQSPEAQDKSGAGAPRTQETPPSPVVIECDPDRHAAGLRAIDRHPETDLFLLDDGFQHRRLHRDLDIVLLHAAEPFGYGHVLPRGLLREPITGIRRAGVVVVTSADSASADQRSAIVAEVRRHHPAVPIVFERHAPTGLRSPTTPSDAPVDIPLAALAGKSALCFSGLGSPGGFERQIGSLAGRLAGTHRFPDHHAYTAADVATLQSLAKAAGADVLATTEKDWVKLQKLPAATSATLPIWRLDVEAQFEQDGGDILMHAVREILAGRPSSS